MEGRGGRENGMREHGWQWGMEDAGNGGRVSRAVVVVVVCDEIFSESVPLASTPHPRFNISGRQFYLLGSLWFKELICSRSSFAH